MWTPGSKQRGQWVTPGCAVIAAVPEAQVDFVTIEIPKQFGIISTALNKKTGQQAVDDTAMTETASV